MPLKIQPKAAVPGGKSGWKRYGALGTVCALVIGVYAYTVCSGSMESSTPNAADTYYNLLVQGFRGGHLSLKKDVPPGLTHLTDPYDPTANGPYRSTSYGLHDMSYYKGRLYLYFGITPVLILFWPFVVLTGHYLFHRQAAVIFCTIGFLASVGVLHSLWRRYFAKVSVWVVASGALALGLATGVPLLLSGVEVYQVPISCGYMLTTLALAAIWRALHEPDRSCRWLAAASVAYGLAVGARPSLLFGAVILLVPVVQAWRGRQRIWGPLMAATGPIMLIGLGLMLYNVQRFDNPFELGQHYQLSACRVPERFFSLHYLLFNFRIYFLEPVSWRARFPFVNEITPPPSPPGHLGVERGFGILPNIPLACLALAVPLVWPRWSSEADKSLRWFVTAVALFIGICALTLGFFCAAYFRYEVDFLPALILLAMVGILGLERALANQPARRQAVRWGWCILLGFSVAFNLLECCLALAFTHNAVGFTLSQTGKIQEAIGLYEQALRTEPEYAEAHYNLGFALGEEGKFQDAIGHYEQALRIKPDFAEAHNNLGLVLERVGRLQDAIGHYEQALRIKPDFAEAHYNLGNALFRAGKLQDAIGHYEQALRIKPDFAEAHSSLGFVLWEAGKFQDAIGHYEQALRIKPDFAEVHNNLGLVLERVGRLQDAIGHYEQALRIKPDYVQAQNSLAWILATNNDDRLRNPAKAVQLAERACDWTQRRYPELLDTLAAAYAANDRFADAIRIAQQALGLAQAAGQKSMARGIQNRLELYKVGHPYYENTVAIEPAK